MSGVGEQGKTIVLGDLQHGVGLLAVGVEAKVGMVLYPFHSKLLHIFPEKLRCVPAPGIHPGERHKFIRMAAGYFGDGLVPSYYGLFLRVGAFDVVHSTHHHYVDSVVIHPPE